MECEGLGDGGASVLGAVARATAPEALTNAVAIPIDRIAPDPDQPRRTIDEESLRQLADSLVTRGQLQPIRVRWDESVDRFVVICGERRYRAAAMAGLGSLECIVVGGIGDSGETLADQLVENALREGLRPMEQARAYRSLIERRGWSARRVAEALSMSPASVGRALSLLELPERIQSMVEMGAVPPAVAYELSKLEDEQEQMEMARIVSMSHASRAEVAEEVRRRRGIAGAKRSKEVFGFRYPIDVPYGRVTVELEGAEPTAVDVIAALSSASRQFKREVGWEVPSGLGGGATGPEAAGEAGVEQSGGPEGTS